MKRWPDVFSKLQTPKPWLDKYLESPFLKTLRNKPKYFGNVNHSTTAYLLINVKAKELEKVALYNMQKFGIACEHTDCRSQVFSS